MTKYIFLSPFMNWYKQILACSVIIICHVQSSIDNILNSYSHNYIRVTVTDVQYWWSNSLITIDYMSTRNTKKEGGVWIHVDHASCE